MIGIADSHAIELNDFIAVKETTEPETMMMNAVSLNKEAVESLALLHSAEAYAASVSLDARLTYAGHDFLEKIRSPQIFSDVKQSLAEIGSFGLQIAADIALDAIRRKILPH